MTPPTPDPHSLLTTLRKQGYVVLPSLLTPQELTTLRSAASRLTSVARTGAWPHVRTVGKQFPPWDASLVPEKAGIWGVQHLLHPDLPVSQPDRDAFLRAYFHEKILAVAGELLSIPPPTAQPTHNTNAGEDDDDGGGKLTMELFNLLVRPAAPFALIWHRDDIPSSASPEEERARLKGPDQPYTHAQYNLPLYDDDSLIVVPGSHARARTEVEREADPYAEELPGQVRAELKAGDVVFYDNNILHRGVYDADRERLTLHGSVGHVEGSAERARNVLQHGVGGWVDRCDFTGLGEGGQRRVAEGMRRRLVRLGRENQGRDVGYSLQG